MRTHYCGELRAEHAGQEVRIAGWVHRRRDHGHVIFLDIRDREGLVQVVADPDIEATAHEVAEELRSEFVVNVIGEVRKRPEGSENPALATGQVEVVAKSIEVVSRAETPPFLIEDGVDAAEEIRIRHRYVDLRRPEMLEMLKLRHRVFMAIRDFLNDKGFLDVETPILTKATPEGARDFLVPSRLDPGSFWALPQSPQLFKQLLMVGGVDRYYQIARCMRDEDPRADRQPDFTQIDLEVSFADEEEILDLTERMMAAAVEEAVGVKVDLPFPRMTYAKAMSTYGSDKPDLRFGLEMTEVGELFGDTGVKIFSSTLQEGGKMFALKVPGAADSSRKELDELVEVAKNLGAGGLAWIGLRDEVSSPLAKFLSAEEVDGLKQSLAAEKGDLILMVCDRPGTAERALGAVRLEIGKRRSLIPERDPSDPDYYRFVWVVDPPLFEWNTDEDRWDPIHHMFTAPRIEQEQDLEAKPGEVLGRCYDLVLNGWELGTGSIRIHRPELQDRVFKLVGLDEETVNRRFGWFLKAYRYGAPPHGGIALGLDRIVALLAGRDNIRDVIAFPKTGTYTDPLTDAPDELSDDQLRELGLKVIAGD